MLPPSGETERGVPAVAQHKEVFVMGDEVGAIPTGRGDIRGVAQCALAAD